MTYLVTIRYEGTSYYFVAAENTEAAEKLAKERYRDGDNGDPIGTEWEEITQTLIEEFEQ